MYACTSWKTSLSKESKTYYTLRRIRIPNALQKCPVLKEFKCFFWLVTSFLKLPFSLLVDLWKNVPSHAFSGNLGLCSAWYILEFDKHKVSK